MTPETENKFYRSAITEAINRFGALRKDSKEIWRSECFVFKYRKKNREYILKLTHSDMRNPNYLMGELDFLRYLTRKRISVAVPVLSENGNYIEIIDDVNNPGQFFMAYSFERMKGKLAAGCRLTSTFLFNWGKVLGEMHRAAKSYEPGNSEHCRLHWYERDLMTDFKDFIGGQSDDFYKNTASILQRAKSYPVNRNSYGLVHADMHVRNFFVDKGNLNIFDFDDSEYHYFVYDIAVPLNQFIKADQVKTAQKVDFFMSNLMEGYREFNKLSKFWLSVMHDFILVRRIYLLSMLYRAESLKYLTKGQRESVKRDIYLIENEIPVTEIDFTKYY